MGKAYKKEAVIQENASFFLFSNIRTVYRVSGSSITYGQSAERYSLLFNLLQ